MCFAVGCHVDARLAGLWVICIQASILALLEDGLSLQPGQLCWSLHDTDAEAVEWTGELALLPDPGCLLRCRPLALVLMSLNARFVPQLLCCGARAWISSAPAFRPAAALHVHSHRVCDRVVFVCLLCGLCVELVGVGVLLFAGCSKVPIFLIIAKITILLFLHTQTTFSIQTKQPWNPWEQRWSRAWLLPGLC